MPIYEDYINPGISQIRHSIKGIDDSYNNKWDILAELIQNSVDAIRLTGRNDGRIELDINCVERSIKILDNGVGINPSDMPGLLKLFSTNKNNNHTTIGEKGVGLKYVIFSSNKFTIKSGNQNGACLANIDKAREWKLSTDDTKLILNVEAINENIEGTMIVVEDLPGTGDNTIFNLNFEQICYVLRTHTAIGNTKSMWDEDINILVKLKYTDVNSQEYEAEIPFRYYWITDLLTNNDIINVEEFDIWLKQRDRTDLEKRTKLRDKIVYLAGIKEHSNIRKIKYYAAFVPKRRTFDDLSISRKLIKEENLQDESWLDQYGYCKLKPGIFTSVKGMPTGISISAPSSGYAGYWGNIFFMFEDESLSFDIGRKSIHGSQANIYRSIAKDVFNQLLNKITKYITGDPNIIPSEWNRDEIFAEVTGIADLNVNGIKFQKIPSSQEASVAAIFYECVGVGKITGLTPLISGYRNKYDLYALWGTKRIVIEFKSSISNLLKDFDDSRKMFDEVDCVVCWEVTDPDIQAFRDKVIELEPFVLSALSDPHSMLPNTTHTLRLNNFTKTIYVIDLKKILKG